MVEQLIIVDNSGRQVDSPTLTKKLTDSIEINIEHLLEGVYFLEIYTDNGLISAKFVKQSYRA